VALGRALGDGADIVVDCLCDTAGHARRLLAHRASFGSAVVLSSKAVYVDDRGRHANSDDPSRFSRGARERNPPFWDRPPPAQWWGHAPARERLVDQ
jgi:hypothetical protein